MTETTPPAPGGGRTGGAAFDRASLLVGALLVALYVVTRLWGLAGTCLWFDEIFSVHAARHTWRGLWSFVAADLIHPPLFYALLKVWVAAGGESLLWLRLFPALTAIAALAPFLLLARELRLTTAETNLALLLLTVNGYLIKYAQEVRMYGLLLFLTLFSLWLFVRLLDSARTSKALLLALFVVNLLLVYTHYYGWLVIAGEAAFLLVRGRGKLRAFLPAVAALALCFAPWVFACLAAVGEGRGLAQNIGWIERPGAASVAQMFALLHEPFYFRQSSNQPLYARGGALLGFLLVGLPLLHLALRVFVGESVNGEGRARALRLLLFFSLFPVALAFLASHALPHSVWGTRHLIVIAAPYLMLAGVALNRIRPVWLKSTVLILLCCWFLLVGIFTLVRKRENYIWCAWENLAASAFASEAGAARAPNVYAFEDLVAYHLWYALGGEGGRPRVTVVKGLPGLAEDPAYFLPRRFDGVQVADASVLDGERLWVAFRDASWDEGRQPLKTLRERGYRAERVFETAAQGQRAFLVLCSRGQRG